MPVSSAILSPKDKEVIIHDGFIHCEGYVRSYLYEDVSDCLTAIDGHTVVVDTGLKESRSQSTEDSSGTRQVSVVMNSEEKD